MTVKAKEGPLVFSWDSEKAWCEVHIHYSLISGTIGFGIPGLLRGIQDRDSVSQKLTVPKVHPVKITIGGIIYDTDSATKLARKPTWSSDQQLYQTPEGDFFLVILQLHVDGLKLKPHEIWIDLGLKKSLKSRLCLTAQIVPMDNRKALEWCIKTQIPAPFRGILLESI